MLCCHQPHLYEGSICSHAGWALLQVPGTPSELSRNLQAKFSSDLPASLSGDGGGDVEGAFLRSGLRWSPSCWFVFVHVHFLMWNIDQRGNMIYLSWRVLQKRGFHFVCSSELIMMSVTHTGARYQKTAMWFQRRNQQKSGDGS